MFWTVIERIFWMTLFNIGLIVGLIFPIPIVWYYCDKYPEYRKSILLGSVFMFLTINFVVIFLIVEMEYLATGTVDIGRPRFVKN